MNFGLLTFVLLPMAWGEDLTPSPSPSPTISCEIGGSFECCSDDDCTSDDSNTCVRGGEYYSQCISCSSETFLDACTSWSEPLQTNAEIKCGQDCVTPVPSLSPMPTPSAVPTVTCDTADAGFECCENDDCVDDDLKNTCVRGGPYYSTCISCDQADFQYSCPEWSNSLTSNAEDECGLLCGMLPSAAPTPANMPTMACDIDNDDFECCENDDCTDDNSCIRGGEYWSSCVDCDGSSFQYACTSWNSTFLAHAVETCGIQCTGVITPTPTVTPVPTEDPCNTTNVDCCADDDCGAGETCVRPTIYYSVCLRCGQKKFNSLCEYWDDQQLTAAEKTCNTTCGLVDDDGDSDDDGDGDDGQDVWLISGIVAGSLVVCVLAGGLWRNQNEKKKQKKERKSINYWGDSILEMKPATDVNNPISSNTSNLEMNANTEVDNPVSLGDVVNATADVAGGAKRNSSVISSASGFEFDDIHEQPSVVEGTPIPSQPLVSK